MFTEMNGLAARGPEAWRAAATTPFPVPFSPAMSTLASLGPTRCTSSTTGRIAGDSATKTGPLSRWARWAAANRSPSLSARRNAIWFRATASTRALSHGFWMKSRAPRRIASTATSTLAHAVITTTGKVGSDAGIRASRSSPSCPLVVSRV